MTDIVERLRRDLASGLSASIGDTEEAADEIDRLRAALEYIIEYCEDPVLYKENKIELTLRKARAALGEDK